MQPPTLRIEVQSNRERERERGESAFEGIASDRETIKSVVSIRFEAPRRDNDRALSGVVGLIGAFPQVQQGTIRNVTRAFSTSQYYFYSEAGERSRQPLTYVS